MEKLDDRYPKDTAAILDKLKGTVADPNRIGDEYMPENMTVTSLKLSNTGSATLPVGALGLNTAGEMVMHDFVRSGDSIAPFASSNLMRGFGVEVNTGTSSTLQTSLVVPLLRLRLPASESAIGKIIGFRAQFRFGATFSTPPDVGVFLVVRKTGETDPANWNTWQFVDLSTNGDYTFTPLFIVKAGNVLDTLISGSYGIRREYPGDNSAITQHESVFTDVNIMIGSNLLITHGQPVDLDLSLITMNDSATVAGGLNIGGIVSGFSA